MIGEEKAIFAAEKELKKYFTVKLSDMNDYLGCTYEETDKGLLIHQPRLFKRMEEKFGEKVKISQSMMSL